MLHIIANALAGSGAGQRALTQVQALLKERGIPFQVSVTNAPGHAAALASEAMKTGGDIVCVGGDGTISEVIDGLAGRLTRMFFVPCGTGNDFVRMLNLPRDPLEALKAQLSGRPRRIDVGRVNGRHFLNVSGTGFDVEVLRQASRFKKLGRGLLPYLMGILAALRKFAPLQIDLTVDGRTERRDVTIISVGNGRYFGGGMKAVPHAEIDDGLFDVVIADRLSKLRVIKLLSKFISGNHTALPVVREFRCKKLAIHCPGMTVNVDGELIPMDDASYELIPGALEIQLPE